MNLAQDSLTDWIQILFTTTAGIFALFLFRQSNKEKRNKYVSDILNKFYGDTDIRTIIYSVDSGKNTKEIKFGGQFEQQADKTIQYFDYLGYLIKEGELKPKDLRPFKYEIKRVFNNETVQEYIEWLKTIGVTLDYLNNLKNCVTEMTKK